MSVSPRPTAGTAALGGVAVATAASACLRQGLVAVKSLLYRSATGPPRGTRCRSCFQRGHFREQVPDGVRVATRGPRDSSLRSMALRMKCGLLMQAVSTNSGGLGLGWEPGGACPDHRVVLVDAQRPSGHDLGEPGRIRSDIAGKPTAESPPSPAPLAAGLTSGRVAVTFRDSAVGRGDTRGPR